jgi:hypothetical protein
VAWVHLDRSLQIYLAEGELHAIVADLLLREHTTDAVLALTLQQGEAGMWQHTGFVNF